MMSEEPIALHVNPTGENWEVESTVGTIAQAETKQEAIEAAKEAAAEHHAQAIIVHTSDGMVEAEIPVRPSTR
ncbi:DUF2188 domain-containing protein [Verrucomicrobiota bacterium sgz303538]